MSQQNLPIYNPQDRGRLNALRNIIATVSDELRRQAPIAQGIVDFTTRAFPYILRQHTPFPILSADHASPKLISPYEFQINDLLTGRPADRDVFPSTAELITYLDISTLAAPLNNVELIGIDESQVDTPLPQSSLSFLKSIAFRMFKRDDGSTDEAAASLISQLRMQLQEGEAFESENKLLSYIRNNYIAYTSALTALAFGRKPFIVLHGPLIRAIGPFSSITFSYEQARDLFNINLADAGEFSLPSGTPTPAIATDISSRRNLPVIPNKVIDGNDNLHQFNEFCLKECGRQCDRHQAFDRKAVPPDQPHVTTTMVKRRDYPGFCLYFWMLRSLYDLARISESHVSSVVEDISAATEMTRLILPSLLAIPQARRDIERSSIRPVLRELGITYPSETYRRGQLYAQARRTIESVRLFDSNIFSYVLSEAQYTSPVQIYRYETGLTYKNILNADGLGTRDVFQPILNKLFPQERTASHPGYRILMSYLRTTPLREPIRVEYFDLPHLLPYSRALGPIYLLSLPYQEYGLPVILYYADKLARTPTRLVRTIIEREYLELVLQNRFSDPVSIMSVLGRLTRGYFQREGLS